MLKYRSLVLQDRQELAECYREGARVADISAALGVHPATIYRELRRGQTEALDENQRPIYDPIKGPRAVQTGIMARGRKYSNVNIML